MDDRPGRGVGDYKFHHCEYVHNGYSVPTGVSGVQQVVADAKSSGGLQSVTWSQGQDIAMVIKAGQQRMDGDWGACLCPNP